MKVIELGTIIRDANDTIYQQTTVNKMSKHTESSLIEESAFLNNNKLSNSDIAMCKRKLMNGANTRVREIECVDKLFRAKHSGYSFNDRDFKNTGLCLNDITTQYNLTGFHSTELDKLEQVNTIQIGDNLTLENINNGTIKIPEDVDYIICASIYLLAELITADDSEIPEIFKNKVVIIPTLYQYIGRGGYYSYNNVSRSYVYIEEDQCELNMSAGYGSMTSTIIENALKLVDNKCTKMNCITKRILLTNENTSSKMAILKKLERPELMKMMPSTINRMKNINEEILSELEIKDIVTIIDSTFKISNTIKNATKLINAIPKETLVKKEIRCKFIDFYKQTRSKNLPGLSILLDYLDKEDIEEIGYLKITDQLTKNGMNKELDKLNKLMNDAQDKDEAAKISLMNYYKGLSTSKWTFPAYITYLNMEDSKFLDKHKEELVSALINGIVKLGYYSFIEGGTLLNNLDNLAVLGPEFCNQLDKRRISVIDSMLYYANGVKGYYRNTNGETNNYKRMFAYVDNNKHTKLAEAYANKLLAD